MTTDSWRTSRLVVSFQVLAFHSAFAGNLPDQVLWKLGSTTFCDREEAQSELLGWGRLSPDTAKRELFGHIQTCQDPEVRIRCVQILRELVIDDYLKEGCGYIGIGLVGKKMKIPQDPKPRSVIRITQIQPNTPASRSAILVGDIIIGLDQEIWHEIDAYSIFVEKIKTMKPGAKVSLQILREGVISVVAVELMRRPIAVDSASFFNRRDVDLEGPEKLAKDRYFRRWLEGRNWQK